MSKVPVKKVSKAKALRHNPLGEEIQMSKEPVVRQRTGSKKRRGDDGEQGDDGDNDQGVVIDTKTTSRILRRARAQQDEIEREALEDETPFEVEKESETPRRGFGSYDSDSDDDVEDEKTYYEQFNSVEIDEDDERVLSSFMRVESSTRQTLADVVLQKLREQEAIEEQLSNTPLQTAAFSEDPRSSSGGIHPKVVSVYKKVATIMSRYRSGKLPKAFNIIPALKNWESVLYMTKPHEWSNHSFLPATKMMISSLNPAMSQRFLNTILLPRVLDDIDAHKKLNYHLYRSLIKASFRPEAFMKGIIIPLCESGTCTLKESQIIASVVSKISLPMLHSAACLMRLADLPYDGPTSIFIRVILDKKYDFPYRLIERMVEYFANFRHEERLLPVLWHQSFLTFIQRYKNDLTAEEKDIVRSVCKIQKHPLITPEILRELSHSVCRGEEPLIPMEEI